MSTYQVVKVYTGKVSSGGGHEFQLHAVEGEHPRTVCGQLIEHGMEREGDWPPPSNGLPPWPCADCRVAASAPG